MFFFAKFHLFHKGQRERILYLKQKTCGIQIDEVTILN